ncbi:hypothetical protein F5148DRAFT_387593 [Russula earlei]|uniref:Uncharacterized protein n=1 Tax=Russula earlei TaxID=71964 RepID=A0ACC0U018_9AGAM|nr:hypothetical protein F5148DRAFT_387593 [Russula earlei]
MPQDITQDEEKNIGSHPRGRSLSLPSQSRPEDPNFGDGSGPLFSIYSKMAAEDDNKMVDRMQRDADSILIFTGLFSAAVASLLSVSIPDLQQSPQDSSNFYLQNINQLLANSDGSVSPPSIEPPPSDFSAPSHAVFVNLLWFLSLLMSLTCAVMAILVQQWARQYIGYTQPLQRGPRTKARIRAMFFGSVDKLFIRNLHALLPSYLHLALLLFLIGLLVFLLKRNTLIFGFILCLFVLSMWVYGFLTLLPLFQHDSLLYTPLSIFPVASLALWVGLFYIAFGDRFNYQGWGIFDYAFTDVGRKAEEIASTRSSEIDIHVLEWSLNCLSDDDAVEKFLGSIPDFFKGLSDNRLSPMTQDKFKRVLHGFLGRTFDSNTVTEDIRNSRLLICLDASEAAFGSKESSQILENILKGKWPELLQSVETGHSLLSWSRGRDERNRLYVRTIISHIIATAEKRNDRWIALAVDQLCISEALLREYLSHGDSIVLADFIDIASRVIRSHNFDLKVPPPLSRFDGSSLLPDLQHDFCVLWNRIVLKARASDDRMLTLILKNFRHAYIGLHEGTDAAPTAFSASTVDNNVLDVPSSYPWCNVASHHPHPTQHGYDETGGDVFRSLTTHPLAQDATHHGVAPAIMPNPFDNLLSPPPFPHGKPLPTPPLTGAETYGRERNADGPAISSSANPNHRLISSDGTASPHRTDASVTQTEDPPRALGFPSPGPISTGPHTTVGLVEIGSASLIVEDAPRMSMPRPVLPEDHQHGTN